MCCGNSILQKGLPFFYLHKIFYTLRTSDEVELFTKKDFKEKQLGGESTLYSDQAIGFLNAFGGAENIDSVANCATRLRISVVDERKVKDDNAFKQFGAHGVVRNKNAFQVIVGLSVPQVREAFEAYMKSKS